MTAFSNIERWRVVRTRDGHYSRFAMRNSAGLSTRPSIAVKSLRVLVVGKILDSSLNSVGKIPIFSLNLVGKVCVSTPKPVGKFL